MNKFLTFSISLLTGISAYAQSSLQVQNISAPVQSAILYLDGAELTQSKTVNLAAGRTLIVFTGITSKLVSRSAQVTTSGDVTVLSVSDKINYLNAQKESPRVKQLKDSVKMVSDMMAQQAYEKEAFDTEKKMIITNQSIGGQDKGVSIAELKLAADFYRSRIKEINAEMYKYEKKINANAELLEKLDLELDELNASENPPSADIEILVSTTAKTSSTIEVKYIVYNAGWAPSYDLIAEDINKPIELKYRAKVFNNTDVDWNDIKIKLSTGDPMKNASKPELNAWYLNLYDSYNYNKNSAYNNAYNYSNSNAMPQQQMNTMNSLQEIEVVDEKKKTKKQEKPVISYEEIQVSELSAEFDIKAPYTIPSDAKPYLVDVTAYNLPATYQHFSVPKTERDAFMLARITGWEDLNLVEGPANVYFGGTYVGQSYINTRSVDDTLDLSFGRDKKIIVTRTKLKDFNKEKVIGNNRKVTYAYEMVIKNNRKAPINIDIEDQLPISQSSDIVVEAIELSKAQQDPANGKLTWNYTLAPDEVKKITLTYSIKYPRNKSVNLEQTRKKARAKF
ncbi:MAG: DUF4139 domain-containing protein [Bacteroidia bacterium]